MESYSIQINNVTIENLTYEQVIKEQRLICWISKKYYKLQKDGTIDKKPTNICLYTAEMPNSATSYINNYTKLSGMYGINALNDNDVELIKKFNIL